METIRLEMKENIFTVLTKQMDRNNKNHYCNNHAMERATMIENSLYQNLCPKNSYSCDNSNKSLQEKYSEIDIVSLVQAVEEKTVTCVYKKS